MKTVTLDQVKSCLQQLPIHEGDGLLVHSALQFLGKPDPGPEIFFKALMNGIGQTGTLVVPTFNFDFCKGEPFNRAETPSDGMGVFAELVRRHPQACRTAHPMQSIAVIGHHHKDLCRRDTPGAFDDGSAFERMLELDFKLLLLGAPVQSASIVHYVEQRHPVPYRYWKSFPGIIVEGKSSREAEYRMFVRDEAIQPELVLAPIEEVLREEELWQEQPLNYGRIAVCSLLDFVSVTARLLRKDPWALILNPPRGEES
ncbi:MAG: AAC(3) family N-acetyltransferase [Anaerolineales bacterium]|nr:AAC(3) family N-acetyltransferase [Anaerolineales bacterium]